MSPKALVGAIRHVVGIDSIGRGLPPASVARVYLDCCCATLTPFVQIKELNIGSSGPSGASQSCLACRTVLMIGVLDVWTAALDATQGK